MFTSGLIESTDTSGIATGTLVAHLRVPWYRSLPLSCITLRIEVDGAEIPDRELLLEVNGRVYHPSELKWIYDDQWFTTDTAKLTVSGLDHLTPGDHRLTADFKTILPYGIVGKKDGEANKAVEMTDRCDRTFALTSKESNR